MNVKLYVSEFKFAELDTVRASDMGKYAWAGLDMLRLPVNLNFRAGASCSEQVQHVHQSCALWLRSVYGGIADINSVLLQACAPTMPTCTAVDQPWTLHDHFLHDLSSHSSEIAITCEDKDNSVPWLQLGVMMMCRWTAILEASHKRWQILDLDVNAVVKHYREAFDGCSLSLAAGSRSEAAHGRRLTFGCGLVQCTGRR